jgi:hypothetical protein
MSDAVKMSADQAYATLVNELAAPYFFEKLSANGIAPVTEKEAADMWSAAQKLHALYMAAREKEAAASTTKMAAANARLDAVLAAAGLGAPAPVNEKFAAFNAAADTVASQPHIANAVLSLQSAITDATQSA